MTWQSFSDARQFQQPAQKLVRIETLRLRDRLNKLYDRLRSNSCQPMDTQSKDCFTRLWDIKEQALISGDQSVLIPARWLDDLEHVANRETHAC